MNISQVLKNYLFHIGLDFSIGLNFPTFLRLMLTGQMQQQQDLLRLPSLSIKRSAKVWPEEPEKGDPYFSGPFYKAVRENPFFAGVGEFCRNERETLAYPLV